MSDLTVVFGNTPAAESIWTSTELIAALFGSVIGGAVTLTATAMANAHTRSLALRAEKKAEAEREEIATWRVVHNFGRIVGIVIGAKLGVEIFLSATPDIKPEDYWRVMIEPVLTSEVIGFNSDDLGVFIRKGRSDLVAQLNDSEINARGVTTLMRSYSETRAAVTLQYIDLINQGASNEALAKADPRFPGLFQMATFLWTDTDEAYFNALGAAEKLIAFVKAEHPAMKISFRFPPTPKPRQAEQAGSQ